MTWYVPHNRLSPRQVTVLNEMTNGLGQDQWLQGFAGTGKTLLVLHLMERVAALNPSGSICFITYTCALRDLVKANVHGPVAARVEVMTHTDFLSQKRRHDWVFLDEVQDISIEHLQRIKSLSGRLYVAGDTDQRIYLHGATEAEIDELLNPRKWKLLEIFRLTRRLRDLAQSILPTTRLIEGLHAANLAETSVKLVRHADPVSEAHWVWSQAIRRARAGEPVAVLFPMHKQIRLFSTALARALDVPDPPERDFNGYTAFNDHWAQRGVDLLYFGNGYGELDKGAGRPFVYLMTFHSSKGLDFRNVFIPAMTEDAQISSPNVVEKHPDFARRLMFVAITRSREELFITFRGGRSHPFFANAPHGTLHEVEAADWQMAPPEIEEFF